MFGRIHEKLTGKLKDLSDSKGVQSGFNGRTFKYYYGGSRFHNIPQAYELSHGICLNNVVQVLLLGNQRDQVPPLRYIHRHDKVSRLVRGRKVIRI